MAHDKFHFISYCCVTLNFKKAKDFFSNVLVGRNIQIINKDLSENINKRLGKFILNVYDKKFDIIHYPKNKTIYLFEVTDRELTKEKFFNSTAAIGVMKLDNFGNATIQGMPAWITFNFRGAYQVQKNLQVQMALENILDVNYRVFASNISAPGRNFVVTLRGAF